MKLYPFAQQWFDKGTVWIISDLHFDDEELKRGFPERPSSAELVNIINKCCGKNDTFICLGDVGDPKYVAQIRAKRKILVKGNHDSGSSNYQRRSWSYSHPTKDYSQTSALEHMMKLHPHCTYDIEEVWSMYYPWDCWYVTADNKLFDEVYEGPIMINEKLILSHEPLGVNWAFNIHGHVHNGEMYSDNYHCNVCADIIDYTPINLNQWLRQGHLSNVRSIHRQTIDTAKRSII